MNTLLYIITGHVSLINNLIIVLRHTRLIKCWFLKTLRSGTGTERRTVREK